MQPLETTLFLCGDVMTGRGVDQALPHPGDPEVYQYNGLQADEYLRRAEASNGPIHAPLGYSDIWGSALREWEARGADLRIVNLETAVTTSNDAWAGKPPPAPNSQRPAALATIWASTAAFLLPQGEG